MKLNIFNPKQALNKAYLKEKVSRENIELFKKNLSKLIGKIDEQESEEHLKNVISEFLKDTWYKETNEINTKDRKDLVIHTGKTTKEPVGVILEVKKPSNKSEMMTEAKPNAKALHELILYYLRERVEHNNIDIKYLVVTNIYEWFIIDEVWFEKNVFRNTKLKKDFENWKRSGNDTKFFYDSIAKPFLETIGEKLDCTYFDLRAFEKVITNDDKKDDNKLIALYKLLSPVHLLKQPFANDSNSLDTKFYSELLHIIGLEEIKEGNQKFIQRKANRNEASIIENTIIKLEDRDCIRNVKNLSSFGSDKQTQTYNIALELAITWINRILFLKLLEAQLQTYHKGNPDYTFLNHTTIHDYDELSNLFFQVLAERPSKRREHLKIKFKNVPYLNSSLFERTPLERQTFDVSGLDNRLVLDLYPLTVLKEETGKRKSKGIPTLQYLFDFLDSYDFTSEGSEEIQEQNKNLINASVLGLIFEKINGYKDGSFFTPGYITMHICKEAIRKAFIDKINEKYKIECETINDIKNFVAQKYKSTEILEINRIVNEITICDPAVGSGHFLVSALNEIISLKSEIGILANKEGVRLQGYEVRTENDELIVTYNNNTEIYQYSVSSNSVNSVTQHVQETIFNEKVTVIENCLFGVDINPNSVKICRLRLWIELLKSSYYTKESKYTELETLPNIDINIKCGNSLVSRFELTDDLSSAFKKTSYTIRDYKEAVQKYKSEKDKDEKEKVQKIIDEIKSAFADTLDKTFLNRISKARGKVTNLETKINSTKQWGDKIPAKLKSDLDKAKKTFAKVQLERDSILSNVNYRDAFEWRFEFPELLDDNCDFVGFDIIIGNPPYGVKLTSETQKFLNDIYTFGTTETAILFIKRGYEILKKNGIQSYIVPKSLCFASNYSGIRDYIAPFITTIVDCGKVWVDVKLEVCIFELRKEVENTKYSNYVRQDTSIIYSTEFDKSLIKRYGFFPNDISQLEIAISEKILSKSVYLNDIASNKRGEGLQRCISSTGDFEVLGGIDISRYEVKSNRGFLAENVEVAANARVNGDSVLVQNIVAHITKPTPHIKIIACIPMHSDYIILDTINQITVTNKIYSRELVWSLLNSKLVNWFVYLFIYGKAIRTMHFDNVITSRLPIPKDITKENLKKFERLALRIQELEQEEMTKIEELETEINDLIYSIYQLTPEEISIIENKSN